MCTDVDVGGVQLLRHIADIVRITSSLPDVITRVEQPRQLRHDGLAGAIGACIQHALALVFPLDPGRRLLAPMHGLA